jgi:amino-acid N-acetyltransferase
VTQISYNIRKAERSDIARIQDLIKANPKTIVPRRSQEFDELLSTFWVAEKEQEIVGCVCLEVYSSKICEIRTLIVDSKYRHAGIGKSLMEAAVAEAKKRKVPQIMVITSDPNYFEKLNFGPDLNEKFALFYQGEDKKS